MDSIHKTFSSRDHLCFVGPTLSLYTIYYYLRDISIIKIIVIYLLKKYNNLYKIKYSSIYSYE